MSQTKISPISSATSAAIAAITSNGNTSTVCYPYYGSQTISTSSGQMFASPMVTERTVVAQATITDVGQIRMGAPLKDVANKELLSQLVDQLSKALPEILCDLCIPEVERDWSVDSVEPVYRVRVTLGFHDCKR